MSGNLPVDAFAYYVALGDARSYAAVADNYGVSKTTVANRATEEDWQGRLEAIEEGVRRNLDASAVDALVTAQADQLRSQGALHAAIRDVMSPDRMRGLVTSMLKSAVQKDNMTAAKLLLERVLGRPRSEPLPADALTLPEGLRTAADVRAVANVILRAVADGSITPEDAQRTAAVVEAARKAVETEDLEQRLLELERRAKKERRG
jgi:hypothetical protein